MERTTEAWQGGWTEKDNLAAAVYRLHLVPDCFGKTGAGFATMEFGRCLFTKASVF